jgi:hypothetical protein
VGGPLTCKITVVLFLPRYIFLNHKYKFALYIDILSNSQQANQASIPPVTVSKLVE